MCKPILDSVGVGCVALRSAESSYTEFCIKLTHHGERTGELTGGIQLHTSKGKQTEKLYGECIYYLLTDYFHSLKLEYALN